MDEVVAAVMEWEDKLLKVEKVYEEIPEILKISALLGRDDDLRKQRHGFMTTTEEVNQNYDKLKQNIFA